MGERKAVLLEVEPNNSLFDAIPRLVNLATNQYSFPSHPFFDGIRKVHAEGYTGSGEIIGIVDTGIDHTHPALKDAILDARDFTTEGTTQDLHGHGTLVALIARYVAPKAKIINAKAFAKDGSAREGMLSAALQWMRSKSPTVVNLSAGIPEADPVQSFPNILRTFLSHKHRNQWLVHLLRKHWFCTCTVCRAADQLWLSGAMVCVAVGNERGLINCPGRGRRGSLMVVGAASISTEKPVVKAYSAYWPDLVAPEVHVAPGTSFSAPFLSGACAVLSEVFEVKSPSVRGNSMLRRADVFFDARDFHSAIVTYSRLLSKDAHHTQHASGQMEGGDCLYCKKHIYTPRMKLAFSYLQTGEALIAVKLFKENVSIAPKFSDARMNLGAALRCAGLLQDSVEAYQQAIILSPNKAEAYEGLADSYVLQKVLPEAIEAFENSHKLDPSRRYPLERLVKIYGAIGDLDRAEHYQNSLSQL